MLERHKATIPHCHKNSALSPKSSRYLCDIYISTFYLILKKGLYGDKFQENGREITTEIA